MIRITVDSIRLVATTEERPGPFGEVEHLERHTIALQGRLGTTCLQRLARD